MGKVSEVKTDAEVKITNGGRELSFTSSKVILKDLSDTKAQLFITDETETTIISVIFTK